MNSALDHKCPNCDAVLKFNPKEQNWKCEYCRSEFNLEQLNTYEEKTKEETKTGEIDLYSCPNCGAEIIADENITTTSCVYCKNTAILKNRFQGEFNPDYLIPFKNTKEDAIEAFKKLTKGKILMPKEFKSLKNIKEMSGIYIPFWLYDYDANGIVEADCKRITSWRSGNYRYTKTDTFLAVRGGNMSFSNVPVDGSKKFSNEIMNSIEPFDYSELKNFNVSYLSGFLSEKYDVDKAVAIEDGNIRAKNSFIEQMRKDITGYNTVIPIKDSINLNNTNSKYVLLPVWLLNIKYKDKIYPFAMNGQTGKLIGDIPIDNKKAFLIWLGLVLIVFIITFIIFYLQVKL